VCFHRFSLYFCALPCYSDHFGFVSLVSFAGFRVIPVASREIGWEERLRDDDDPFCVEWHVKPRCIRASAVLSRLAAASRSGSNRSLRPSLPRVSAGGGGVLALWLPV